MLSYFAFKLFISNCIAFLIEAISLEKGNFVIYGWAGIMGAAMLGYVVVVH